MFLFQVQRSWRNIGRDRWRKSVDQIHVCIGSGPDDELRRQQVCKKTFKTLSQRHPLRLHQNRAAITTQSLKPEVEKYLYLPAGIPRTSLNLALLPRQTFSRFDRYKFRPPRYYRGPLHPHQPPKPSDIASREFIPGPFTLPRLAQTYSSTIAPDFMTLTYQHYPPGYEAPTKAPRLRSWDDSSPYHKNRPLRGPRGGDTLRLLRKPITFRNTPKLEAVVVHSFVKEATKGTDALYVASMAIQAITGVRVQHRKARHNVVQWGMRAGKLVALTSELKGEGMYHFIAKLVDVVMPKMKDWRGVKGSSGDTSGNITFGMEPDQVAYFPEIEVNYDA